MMPKASLVLNFGFTNKLELLAKARAAAVRGKGFNWSKLNRFLMLCRAWQKNMQNGFKNVLIISEAFYVKSTSGGIVSYVYQLY